jgi:hypothetical protein
VPKKRNAATTAWGSRKRTLASKNFVIAEDPKEIEQISQVYKEAPRNTETKFESRNPLLSAAALSKLEAFKYNPDSTPTKLAQSSKHLENTSILSADVDDVKQRNGGQYSSTSRLLCSAISDQESANSETLYIDRNIATQRRFPETNLEFLDDYFEDDTIFNQFIAEEAETLPTNCPPDAKPMKDAFSTPTSQSPFSLRSSPAFLVAAPFNRHVFTPPAVSRKPTFRASLPSPAPTLSLIPNLTPCARIPTCFRIGEAIRLLSSTPCTQFRAIELYAVVVSSFRQQGVQTFQFADLYFPRQPPYLHGTYAAWNDSVLYEQDSATFLKISRAGDSEPSRDTELSMCRAIIRPTRSQTISSASKGGVRESASSSLARTQVMTQEPLKIEGRARLVEILSIWKCDWGDIEYVKGIVMDGDTLDRSTNKN